MSERKRAKQTADCCDYIVTPRKPSVSCDPESLFRWRSSAVKNIGTAKMS
ncbi:hypothetical protein [Methanosarcina siciliae]|nr:hypothetical protein [Methanosarcina siciliae]